MTSRMDRYYKKNTITRKRSDRNRDLYKTIYETSDYSNIEAVATIDKGNEIDINKVKDMLKNSTSYAKKDEIKQVVKPTYEDFKKNSEPERTYDIRQILSDAKTNKSVDNKYQSLNNTDYDIFKELREKRRKEIAKEEGQESELRELIDTIANTSMLNSMNDQELSLDLLDDLKSSGKTAVVDKDSIKSILEEAKQAELKKEEKKPELDKSFYTSSLSFKDDDFEQLANLNNNIKKNNILIKILLVIVCIFALGLIVWGIVNLIK